MSEDCTREITLRGSIPQGHAPVNYPYPVDIPSQFAADVLIGELRKVRVTVAGPSQPTPLTGDQYRSFYRPNMLVSEIVSPPLSEDVKVTLKVSQNLHAAVYPYVLGAVLGKAKVDADIVGLRMIHNWLGKNDVDTNGAAQADGYGANDSFTPNFMVHFLAFMASRPTFRYFKAGLPVLGRDGTLADVQKSSVAAGRVFAKTGTYEDDDALNHGVFLEGAGLAGYTTTPSGEPVAFAAYINKMPIRDKDGVAAADRVTAVAFGRLGAIAASINQGGY